MERGEGRPKLRPVLAAAALAFAVAVGLLPGSVNASGLSGHIDPIQARFVLSEYATHYTVAVTGFESPIKASWTLKLTCVDPGCPDATGTETAPKPNVDSGCDNNGVGTMAPFVEDLEPGQNAEFIWHHPSAGVDPKYHCDHAKEGPRGHQGLITVVVSDEQTRCTATYKGTESSTTTSVQNGTSTLGPCCPIISVTDTGVEKTPFRTGMAYKAFFRASGGAGPYTFHADSLPPGLTLNPNGTLSGTPTKAGKYTFVVTATDADGCTGEEKVTVTVTGPRPVTPPKPVVPPKVDFVLIHKQVMHELALSDLDDAEHGGLVNVVQKQWGKYSLPTFQPKTETEKKIKKIVDLINEQYQFKIVKTIKDKSKIVDKAIEIVGNATSVVFYVDYYFAEADAQDPPDPDFTVVALPAKPSGGPYLTGRNVPPDVLSSANALLANAAQYAGTTRAFLTDLQRTEGAVVAHNSAQTRRLALATAKLAKADASVVSRRARLRDAFAAALKAHRLRFSLDADMVRLFAAELARTGLSPQAASLAAKLGATGPLGARSRQALKNRAKGPASAFSIPDAFDTPAQRASDARLASSFSRLAVKLRALAKAP